ncbi:MAG: glycosyltransferase family 2 protein, partial [Solirubrobacteraceae bacterium]
MSPPIDVAVVVATRDRAGRLAQLLDALERQTLASERMEVVVVDDGSSDGTGELLAERADGPLPLRWVSQPQSRGPAAARNRGWRMTTAPLIAFTDDDCVPAEGWLEALLTLAAARPQAVVQGCTLPNPAELEGLDAFAKTLTITGPSPHFQTCNIIYPRPILEQLDGFDEAFPAPTGEDT